MKRSLACPSLVKRLALEKELEGHKGCVNCLKWSESGRFLASGSDDLKVLLWEPGRAGKTPSTAIRTGHGNNIFSVEWVPETSERELLSGAGDGTVRLLDATRSSGPVTTFSCHHNRVKRLGVTPSEPWLFWSAGEDGRIMEFDLRADGGTCQPSCSHCLLDLTALVGEETEAKCLAISPTRPELIAVGANDPFVRLFDRRMLSKRSVSASPRVPNPRQFLLGATSPPSTSQTPSSPIALSPGAFRVFCPGHLQLPRKSSYRSLVTTYLSFHPSGSELLVNLGGEQIYIFPLNAGSSLLTELPGVLKKSLAKVETSTTNGHNRNGTSNGLKPSPRRGSSELDLLAEALKDMGNNSFSKKAYGQAIEAYSGALLRCPDNPVLHANRAAALLKRGWDGDVYAALKDAYRSLTLDPNHTKALFRLAKCLGRLGDGDGARDALALFRARFPRETASASFRDLASAIAAVEGREEYPDPPVELPPNLNTPTTAPAPDELRARAIAGDFSHRFVGHCNTTTDIKEASYVGRDGELVVAGSDDGTFFVWERASGRIVSVLRGDTSIVNCLQPAPSELLLATSGIDSSVKLWRPGEAGETGDGESRRWRVADVEAAARANQRRMNADPFEAMLLQFVANPPHRPSSEPPGNDEEDEAPGTPTNVHCAQS